MTSGSWVRFLATALQGVIRVEYVRTPVDVAKYQEFLEKVGKEELAAELWLQWKALTDLYFLGAVILGMDKIRDGGRPRLDPVLHGWLAGEMSKNMDSLILIPRGHMKSAWVKVKIVQLILQNPNIRIGLFSRTSSLVESQLNEIRQLFCTPELMRLFKDRIPDPGKRFANWKRSVANELTIFRSPEWGRVPQENQVEAWGVGATIVGRHYDVIVMDDIINEQSCSTPEQIRKVRDWYSYIQSIKDPEGFELMVGTRYHYSDIYGTVIKENWYGNRVFIRRAVEDGRPIYRFFTLAMLNKIRQRQGAYEYSCQYDNNPVPRDDQIFPPPQPTYSVLPEGRYTYYMTVDPAATAERYSDDTGVTIGAVDSDGFLYVVRSIRIHEKPDRMVDELIRLIVQYKPVTVGIEFGLQAGLQYLLDIKKKEYEQISGRPLRFKLESIEAPRSMSKEDKINRVLGGLVRTGRVFIHESCSDLLLQMEFFPKGEHDDLVDSLTMMVGIVKEFQLGPQNGDKRNFARNSLFDIFKKKTGSSWEAKFVT